jgi:simple sugar transport system permease protein
MAKSGLKLEARPQPSKAWGYGSPVLALLVTVVIGVVLFVALGKDPVRGLQVFFWEPVKNGYALGELVVKATPLLVIALGLAVCFRSNVWNIGAEGQYIIGAVAASGVALLAEKTTGGWIVVPIVMAGIVGGMFWAGITAFLRDKFNANEILVSLMMVYVAVQVLGYLVYGPWKDPLGYNFPQTKTFEAVTRIPRLFEGSRMSIGVLLALVGVAGVWIFLFSRWAAWHQRRRATPGFRHAKRCGLRCWSLAAWPGWRARWRWLGPSGSLRPTCQQAMDSPPSSWPMWGACTRWAWCSRRCL